MGSWHRKYQHCLSCNTEDWKYSSKGYCVKCSPIIKRLEIVKGWDIKDSNTLIPIPGFNAHHINIIKRNDRFNSARAEIIRQLKQRLLIYKNCNKPENIDGMSMEVILNEIAQAILKNDSIKLFHGVCSKYDFLDRTCIESLIMDLHLILAQRKFKLDLTPILMNY